MNQAGALIECAETYSESYGTPRTVLAGLCDRALILTGGGALALRQRLPNSISIFIQPASAAAAAERILDRNCPNSEYRIAGYEQEVAASSQFDRVFLNIDFDETLNQIEDFYLSARGRRPHNHPTRKFDTGAGKGTGDGPILCVPRLETGAKSRLPLSQLLPGEIRIDGRRVSQLVPALQGDRGLRSAFGQEVLRTGSKPGRSVPTPAMVPSEVTAGPELVNAISDDKLRRSA